LKTDDIFDKIDVLEQELLKSKQNEVNLGKKILRLESLAFHHKKKHASFRSKAPKVLETSFEGSENTESKMKTCEKKENIEKKFLTPNNMRIIEAFHDKKTRFSQKSFRFSDLPIIKPMNTFHSPPSLEIPKKIHENSQEKSVLSDNHGNFISPLKSPENFIEKVKAGAIEVIIEKEQEIHNITEKLAESDQEVQRLVNENFKLKQSFSKIFEEMQYENENLGQKLIEEKVHYRQKIHEKESKIQENCNEFVNEQLEKYKKMEILLNSELDEKKNVVSRLERENFLLNMQICENQRELRDLEKELERGKEEGERELVRNKAKNQDILDKISEKEMSFKEKYEEIEQKLRISEEKCDVLKRDNNSLLREKSEIYERLEDLLEEKQEIEKVNRDLKEFSRGSIEKYEKIIEEIQVCFKRELDSQKQELSRLKECMIPSMEEIKENCNLMNEIKSSNEEEIVSLREKVRNMGQEIENLKEEVRIVENIAIEAKLLAAQASTDRDYFQFKYRQSLEFIKGMTGSRGGEGNEKPQKESFNFFKEIVKKFIGFKKGAN